MESMSCPRCGAEMEALRLSSAGGEADVHRCPEGHGVFLSRGDLGALVEAESDWHRHAGQHTAPLPRITAETRPPPPAAQPARAWVETLFR